MHSIVPVDKDPWTWRKLRNVQEVAQQEPDGAKKQCFVARIHPQLEQRVYDTLAVDPRGSNMVAGSCSTLADDVRLDGMHCELEIVGFPARQAKSARRS